MKREWLKGLGLEDEVIDKIMAENGNDIEKHKTASETAKTESDNLKAQLAERDKQLKELSESAGDNEDLKNQITKLQNDNKTAKETYQKQLNEVKLNNAIDMSLVKANAIDTDLVKVKLDREKITLKDDGTLNGLDEQLKSVQKDFGFLFKAEPQKGDTKFKGVTSSGGDPQQNQNTDDLFLQGFGTN